MQREDNHQKYIKNYQALDTLNARVEYQTIRIRDLEETIGNYEEVDDMSCEYIQELEEQRATLAKDIEKLTSVLDEQGTDSLDALGCVLEHTTPNDTEMNERRKFMRLFHPWTFVSTNDK